LSLNYVKNKLTSIILAGGEGTRLGNIEKAFVTFDGKYLIDRKIATLKKKSTQLIIVTNRPELYTNYEEKIAIDKEKQQGPLMGIYSGLLASSSLHNFVTAVDMPFFHEKLFSYLQNNCAEYDAVIPVVQGNYEPLFAIYSRNCLPAIENAMKEKRGRIISFLQKVKAKYINEKTIKELDPDMRSFINLNTETDIKMAETMINRR